MDPLIGHQLGKYQLQAEIGRGGMGIVYRGYDPALRRPVAIKVLPPQLTYDSQFVQRFQQEAILAASLRCPGIVTIHDVGEQGGVYYIVMEYLEGQTLERWLAGQGPLAPAQAATIVRQIAEALDFAHGRGVVHRDIKPANVMIGPDGRATLMDFGLVRAAEGTSLTRSGMVLGTPEYMAPEQALGEPVDGRSDVYALGVVLYKMLSGKVPFSRTTPYAITYAHIHEPPPPLRQVRGDLSAALEAVVNRALAKRPAERYARAGLLADDLEAAASGKSPVSVGTQSPRRIVEDAKAMVGKRDRPRPWLWLTLTAIVMIILVSAIWALTRPKESDTTARLVSTTEITTSATAEPRRVGGTSVALTVSPMTPEAKAAAASLPNADITVMPATPTFTPKPTLISPTATSTPEKPAFTVTELTVNVRSGPGVNYPKVGEVRQGQTYEITGKNPTGDWWQFSFNGQPAWVLGQYANPNPAAQNVPVAANIPQPPADPGRIVFSSDRDGFAHLFMVRGDGSNLQAITSGREYFWDPILTEDGTKLAFVSKLSGNTEVFVARSDGREQRAISNHPAEDDHPAWFPGGTELAFASRRDGAWEIYRMNSDGSNVRRLTWAGGDNRFVAVSPDGRQIAYVTQNGPYPNVQLIVMSADGSSSRSLLSYSSRKQRDDPGRYIFQPARTTHGILQAFGADDDDDGLISVVVLDVATGQKRILIRDGNGPAWSPDSQRLIYKPAGDRQILYVADSEGRQLYQLTGSDYNAWSPDWVR